jgi:hypothetical protein
MVIYRSGFPQNLNIELFSPECALPMTFWTKHFFKLIGPPALCVLLVVVYFIYKSIIFRFFRQNDEQKSVRLKKKKIATFLGFVFIGLYTSSVSTALSPFNCRKQSNGTYVLNKDASITCFDDSWRSHIVAISSGIGIYVFVVPMILLYIYVSHRKDHDSFDFLKNYEFLISPYRYPCYYWEMVVMLKRTLFVVCADFLVNFSYYVKYGTSVLILFLFLWIEIISLPYSNESLNMLNITYGFFNHLHALTRLFSDGTCRA